MFRMKTVNPAACEREREVARAVRSGLWSAELREHAAGCEACGEAMAVAAFLQSGEDPVVPEAGLMWWRLELRARREKHARAMRPLVVAEGVAAALVGLSCVAGLVWLSTVWPALGLTAGIAGGVLAVSAGSALLLAASRK
jgi:hypothetical protein